MPAKKCKVKTTGKIGNTTLPFTEDEKASKGVVLIPNAKVTNVATLSKNTLDRLIEKEEKLIYTVELSYSDWEDYEKYEYPSYYEIAVTQKSPLNLTIRAVSGN